MAGVRELVLERIARCYDYQKKKKKKKKHNREVKPNVDDIYLWSMLRENQIKQDMGGK